MTFRDRVVAGDDHPAALSVLRLALDNGAKGGMVRVQPGAEMSHEVLDLVDRDGIAHAHVDPAAFLERAAPIDPHQAALRR